MFNLKNNQIVEFSISENLYGTARVVGVATQANAIIGPAYIIKPIAFGLNSMHIPNDDYPYQFITAFEIQLTKITKD